MLNLCFNNWLWKKNLSFTTKGKMVFFTLSTAVSYPLSAGLMVNIGVTRNYSIVVCFS